MKFVCLLFFFSIQYMFGQVQGKCFTDFNPLAYGVDHRIEFNDSTFEYTFVEGLISGTSSGTYRQEGSYLILNSTHQPRDYTLKSFVDSSNVSTLPVLRVSFLQILHSIQVQVKNEDGTLHELKNLKEQANEKNSLDTMVDTAVCIYSLPRNKEIVVSIQTSNGTINFKTNETDITYSLDLTRFPQELYYVFFTNQMLLVKKDKLCFVDEQKQPERKIKIKQTRKGIQYTKSKKIHWFMGCTTK